MTLPLRALIVEPDNQGGHWHYATTLARALAARRVDVRLATLSSYERLDGIDELPIVTIGEGDQSPDQPMWHLYRRMLNHAEKVRRLLGFVREFRPQIVHLHGALGKLDFSYFGLIRRFGARVVFTAYDLPPSRWFDMFNQLRCRSADLVLVHAGNGVADLRRYGVRESRIMQIPHVSFHALYDTLTPARVEAKASLGLPPHASTLLFFGHIEPRKGLDLLIDALAKLSREHPDVYLIVAGRPAGDFAPYAERIAKSGLMDRVILDLRYIPFDAMRMYFASADVVVLPYRRIQHSGVLQLAYVFGRPVVVTDVGEIGKAVAADGTGVVADAVGGDALANAILSLLANTTLAHEMGKRGPLLAQTKYSAEAVAERLEAVYRELAGGPRDIVRDYEPVRRN